MSSFSCAPYVDPRADALVAQLVAPRQALFLDRDGIININHGYVHTPEATDWVPGIFELVASAQSRGLATVVVTNQAGIARGYYDEAQFERYTAWMHDYFEQQGVPLLATYHCPHHPDFGALATRVCACRKPQPGMLLQAENDWQIILSDSILIGDRTSDIEAARRAGITRTFLAPSGDLSGAKIWLSDGSINE